DRSSEMVTAVQNQEMGAPFWCKTCKWLFKHEESYGLTKTEEGFTCGKCKGEITVMGSAAQHAFNVREKDKTKRWGPKGDGQGHPSEKAPITPAPQGEGDPSEKVPITPVPGGQEDNSGGSAQTDPLFPWFSDLGDEKGTPEWYNYLHEAVCRKGKPYRELAEEFVRFISLLSEEGMAKYGKDYKSLKHQNKELSKVKACEEAKCALGSSDRCWEPVYGGSLWDQWPVPGGLCQKGATPLVLVGDAPDISVGRMMDLFSMLPMIGAEICVDGEAQKDQHPERLKEWQRTDCLPLNVVCNGIRWVADLMCQSVPNKDPNGVLPKWAFWIYSNYKELQYAMAGHNRDLMTCEETRPVLSWECSCPWHSTNAYVLKHKVYLPVHLLVNVVSLVLKHLEELKAEMLQLEALVAKDVNRQQLQQELKRKAEEQEKDEEAKKPRVEEPAMQAAPAPAASGVPQFALTEEAFRRTAEMVTQNLLQTMPMLAGLGQPAPVVAPTGAPMVDHSGVMAARQDELGDRRAAAQDRRKAWIDQAWKKAEGEENLDDFLELERWLWKVLGFFCSRLKPWHSVL
ncbi:unnamed protein product, partial [Symbiodinium sp. CCMP2456]